MATHPKPATGGDSELLLPFTGVTVRGGVACAVLLGLLTIGAGSFACWPLYDLLAVTGPGRQLSPEDPSSWATVAFIFVLFGVWAWVFGWFTAQLLVRSWRVARGGWWLRLSSTGLEVNDRLGRPRRYEWRDIDRFMLVSQSQHFDTAVPAPAKTFAEALADGDSQVVGSVVGLRLVPDYPRTYWQSRIHRIYRDRDGIHPDGAVVGYWDRPFDEAVDLLNDWLTRYRTA